jgi:hypothetical protein
MLSFDGGEFYINNVRLLLPPQSIQIRHQSINSQYQTLRTRSSTKIPSGHALVDITVTAAFTDTLDPTGKINGLQQLQDLVTQLPHFAE